MLQVIMRIIFEPNSSSRHPLGMFLCDPLLRNQRHLDFLPFPQLANQRAFTLRIRNHRIAHPLVRPLATHHQIPSIHMHDLVAGTPRMQRQGHAAPRTVVLAFAVARVLHVLVAVLGVQGDQPDSMRQELVREH